jgi:hypothetical protein
MARSCSGGFPKLNSTAPLIVTDTGPSIGDLKPALAIASVCAKGAAGIQVCRGGCRNCAREAQQKDLSRCAVVVWLTPLSAISLHMGSDYEIRKGPARLMSCGPQRIVRKMCLQVPSDQSCPSERSGSAGHLGGMVWICQNPASMRQQSFNFRDAP